MSCLTRSVWLAEQLALLISDHKVPVLNPTRRGIQGRIWFTWIRNKIPNHIFVSAFYLCETETWYWIKWILPHSCLKVNQVNPRWRQWEKTYMSALMFGFNVKSVMRYGTLQKHLTTLVTYVQMLIKITITFKSWEFKLPYEARLDCRPIVLPTYMYCHYWHTLYKPKSWVCHKLY